MIVMDAKTLGLGAVGILVGYWGVSRLTATEEQASEMAPADAERALWANTEAQRIIPYSLDGGHQGALYKGRVFETRNYHPTEGPLDSRPALTTPAYDRAFGSGPSRTQNLPYRYHEADTRMLDSQMVAGSYALPEVRKGAEGEVTETAPEQPTFQGPLNSEEPPSGVEMSRYPTDAWKKVGWHENTERYPLIPPRTNSVITDLVSGTAEVRVPEGQFLSTGSSNRKVYDPFTPMHEGPDFGGSFTTGEETLSRREWEQRGAVQEFGDQSMVVKEHGGGVLHLRRR